MVLVGPSRLHLTRKEGYERALAIINRLHQLSQLHGWSPLEQQIALTLNDENLPIQLHLSGKHSNRVICLTNTYDRSVSSLRTRDKCTGVS